MIDAPPRAGRPLQSILDLRHGPPPVSDQVEGDERQKRIPVVTLQEILREVGFERFFHRRFEFGLNNLMVATHEDVRSIPG